MWNKLWAKITASSIWEEDPIVRVVWVSLLSSAGADGIARVNPIAVYRLANVSKKDADRALEVLASPDPQSSSKNDEGRRIRVIDGEGILLINHAKHHVRTPGAERQARYRKRKSARNGDAPCHKVVTTRPDQTRPDQIRQEEIPPTPQETQGQPIVWRTLEGWEPPPGLRDEAVMAGVPVAEFDARLSKLRNGPIGGSRGVLDRTQYVRDQFGTWRTWAETERARAARPRPARFGGGGAPLGALTPKAKHEAFAAKHGLSLATVLTELNEANVVDKLGLKGAQRQLEMRLAKMAKEARAK